MSLKTSLSVALISAAVRTFLRTRKDLRRDGEMFGGGLALTTVLDPLKTFRRASYFPAGRETIAPKGKEERRKKTRAWSQAMVIQ